MCTNYIDIIYIYTHILRLLYTRMYTSPMVNNNLCNSSLQTSPAVPTELQRFSHCPVGDISFPMLVSYMS